MQNSSYYDLLYNARGCDKILYVEELLGVAEVAKLLGVTYQRAHQLAESYPDFPQPAALVGTRRGWRADEVQAWAEAHRDRGPGKRILR